MALNGTGSVMRIGGKRMLKSGFTSSSASTSSSSCLPTIVNNERQSFRQFSSSAISQAKPRRQRQKEDPFALEKMGKFNYDDIPTAGHLFLREKREELHYARLQEWEMPKLVEFRKPYQPPKKEEILRVKNIHYQGEPHPVTRKAVITVRVQDLFQGDHLSSKEAKRKFLLLAGPRWNPFEEKKDVLQAGKESQIKFNPILDAKLDLFGDHAEIERKVLDEGGLGVVKISCERFPNAQMNLKWCSDVVDNLIAEANSQPEKVKDVPLDLRHAQARENSKKGLDRKSSPTLRNFPQEWLPRSNSSLE